MLSLLYSNIYLLERFSLLMNDDYNHILYGSIDDLPARPKNPNRNLPLDEIDHVIIPKGPEKNLERRAQPEEDINDLLVYGP